MADAAVARADELDALRLELDLGRLDVRHPHREAADARVEVDAFLVGLPERERHLAGRQLVRIPRIDGQTDDLAVPRARGLGVPRRDVEEVDALDVHS